MSADLIATALKDILAEKQDHVAGSIAHMRMERVEAVLRLLEQQASAKEAPAVMDGELRVVGWLTDWPEEPELGHTYTEHKVLHARSLELVTKGAAIAYGQECARKAGDGQAVMELKQVYEAFGIGEQARTMPTLLMNIENARRRSECLWAIEREFFTKEVPVEDWLAEEPGDTHEECPLMWGAGREEYVEQFRAALAELTAAPAAVAQEPVAVPKGWKMVPIEPDDAMQAAGPGAIRFDTTVLNKMWTANAVYRAMIAAAPIPPAAQAGDAADTARLDFITTFGVPWSVQWMKKGDKPVRFRMVDDGDPWGQWHPTARAAIDVAMMAKDKP